MTLRLCLCVRASRLELQAENPHTFSVAYASQFSIEKLQAEIIRTSGARHDLRCAIATCELRCAVASCDVRVRTQFFEACDVRACGTFLDLRCAITILHVLKKKLSFFWCKSQFCSSKIEDFSN